MKLPIKIISVVLDVVIFFKKLGNKINYAIENNNERLEKIGFITFTILYVLLIIWALVVSGCTLSNEIISDNTISKENVLLLKSAVNDTSQTDINSMLQALFLQIRVKDNLLKNYNNAFITLQNFHKETIDSLIWYIHIGVTEYLRKNNLP